MTSLSLRIAPSRLRHRFALTFLVCASLAATAQRAPLQSALQVDAATGQTSFVALEVQRPGKPIRFPTFLDSSNATVLQVINRKFLTSYTFFITGTKAAIPPPIRDLEEATNLTLGTATLIPPSKGDVGTVSVQTASAVFLQLLDETTFDQVNTQLEVDYRQMVSDNASLTLRLASLRCQDATLRGVFPVPALVGCTSNGSPNLQAVYNALLTEVNWGTGAAPLPPGRPLPAPFTGIPPFTTGEAAFAQMNIWIQDRLNEVKALQTTITQVDLANTATRLDASITQFEKNADQFQGNIRAIRSALALYNTLGSNAREKVTRELFKARYSSLLKAQPTDPALTLDPGELNTLVDAYINARLPGGGAINPVYAGKLITLNTNVGLRSAAVTLLVPGAQSGIATPLRDSTPPSGTGLAAVQTDLATNIPVLIAQINSLQSQMVERANFIYDNSRVAVPQIIQIDLSKAKGNQYVHYLIQYNDGFPRYVIQTPITPPSTTATVVATQLPAPVVTQPAATPATPLATPITTPVAGQAPITGFFEVHEFQSAAVIASVAISSIRDNSFGTQPLYFDGTPAHPFPTTGPCQPTVTSTTTNGTTTTTITATPCYASYQTGNGLQPQAMIGIMYYLRLHDSFFTAPYSFSRNSGIVAGISANTANTFFLGVATEPHVGLNIGGGIEFGSESRLQPSILALNQTASTTAPTYTRRINKPYVSIGLDLNIFRKVFGKVFGFGSSSSAAPAS
jgi:hypothetical protein